MNIWPTKVTLFLRAAKNNIGNARGSFASDAGEGVLPERQTFATERLFGCETVFFRTPSLHEFSRVGAFCAAEGGIVAQLQSLQSWKMELC